jgi:hypothetical protein
VVVVASELQAARSSVIPDDQIHPHVAAAAESRDQSGVSQHVDETIPACAKEDPVDRTR